MKNHKYYFALLPNEHTLPGSDFNEALTGMFDFLNAAMGFKVEVAYSKRDLGFPVAIRINSPESAEYVLRAFNVMKEKACPELIYWPVKNKDVNVSAFNWQVPFTKNDFMRMKILGLDDRHNGISDEKIVSLPPNYKPSELVQKIAGGQPFQ